MAAIFAVLAPAAAVMWVVADATAIQRREVLACGESDCRPSHWGAAVFLLPPVGIPMYWKFRRLRVAQLDSLATPAPVAVD
jgi:hypothetical protein